MGCDIHTYIEYKDKSSHRDPEDAWESFGGEIHLDRNYLMFTLMAGVRSDGKIKPVAPLRGFPKDAAYGARNGNHLRVVDDDALRTDGDTKRSNAELWLKSGCSEVVDMGDDGKTVSIVTHPDWHSHSWLTATELKQSIARWKEIAEAESKVELAEFESNLLAERKPYETDEWVTEYRKRLSAPVTVKPLREYLAVQRAMEAFEETGCEARLVFWFDN